MCIQEFIGRGAPEPKPGNIVTGTSEDGDRRAERHQPREPRTAAFGMRMQPCETRPGRISGWFVPWMPMKPPPGQSVSTFERASVPNAIGP